jgi:hypothetical protein
MVRLMLDTLKVSNEPRYLVDLAVKYLRGVKGSLVQSKKRAREASEAKAKVSTSGDGQGGSSYGSGDGNGFGASGPSNSHHGNNRSGYRQAGGYPPIAAEAEQ